MVEVVVIGYDLGGGQRQVPGDHDHGVEGGQALAEVRTGALVSGLPDGYILRF